MVHWDAQSLGAWAGELEGADPVINLAGRSVDCRYTPANKESAESSSSRVDATRALGTAIRPKCTRALETLDRLEHGRTIYRHAEDRDMDEETGELGKRLRC
ncbi:MAG: hypothetical protein IPP33_07000 [Flavobacteriales bacterium]|nr:hypothetical protein [Flavobacteriales bacterium]